MTKTSVSKQETAHVKEDDVAASYQYEMMLLSLILEHKGFLNTADTITEIIKLRDAANRLVDKGSDSTKTKFKNVISITATKKWF